ncbi:SDR family oxidoreductase [Citreimonas sp.]|uniref:SDR family oxidoreductase n=1 Tax=Citreimonas sp. TaxID=3036715 RepID=UPI004058018E
MADRLPTAIVTGAARGIGRGVAEHLAARNWRVAALDVDFDDDGPGRQVRCDVSDESAVRAAFGALADMLDGGLDLLVNNAGIADPETGPVEELSLDDWNLRLAVNLTGPFLMVKHAVPHLRAARGAVVNVTSTRAMMSEPDCEAYAATKGGLSALTHALAVSLGPEVRVNAVAPGWIWKGDPSELSETDHAQHPAGRAGSPQDIAEAVHHLARAGFTTGQVLTVDGGMTRKMIYAE